MTADHNETAPTPTVPAPTGPTPIGSIEIGEAELAAMTAKEFGTVHKEINKLAWRMEMLA